MAFFDQLTRFLQFVPGSQVEYGPKSPYIFNAVDDLFKVCDPADRTKCVRFDAGAVTTATTRVFSLPDNDVGGSTGAVTVNDQYAYQSAAFALPNNTSLNAMFTAAHDTFTALAATTYRFELVARLTTGATTHTTAFGLLGAGTATLTSVMLMGTSMSAADATLAASQQAPILVGTAQVVTATSTAVKTGIYIAGSFQTNAAGTIIPSIQFSADPTGTCQTDIGSYCRISAVGANTFTGTAGWS